MDVDMGYLIAMIGQMEKQIRRIYRHKGNRQQLTMLDLSP
jgi:hypothetical protein|tara:strand:+ start:550 stop:669 length:120 start_codon:yes stop_codon:yes gene_type:complete